MPKTHTRIAFGVDIGGSKIRYAVLLCKPQIKIVNAWTVPTPKAKLGLVKELSEALAKAATITHHRPKTIGIGLPGPLSADLQRVVKAQNTPQLAGLSRVWLSRKLKVRVVFDNDARAFTFAEALLGAGKRYKRVLGITVGTGVGGGLVQNGRLETGAHGSAGEIGNMVIEYMGLACTCGGRGHLESYIAHRAFVMYAGKDAKSVEQDARAGSAKAKRVYEKVGTFLGIGIASAVNLWDPDIIVVGGGIGNAGDLLLRPARTAARRELASPIAKKRLKIVKAHLGHAAGAIGAALISMV